MEGRHGSVVHHRTIRWRHGSNNAARQSALERSPGRVITPKGLLTKSAVDRNSTMATALHGNCNVWAALSCPGWPGCQRTQGLAWMLGYATGAENKRKHVGSLVQNAFAKHQIVQQGRDVHVGQDRQRGHRIDAADGGPCKGKAGRAETDCENLAGDGSASTATRQDGCTA